MKFIVLEGLDGAGKSTQVSLLTEYLNKQNIQTKFLHFPRTESPYFGEMIARFLRGDFGDIDNVNPYLVAMLYAGDRKDASEEIISWIKEDFVVIADRYVFSNIAYQCAKLKSQAEKDKLKNWIIEFEFGYYNLPKPDLNLFLDVPFLFTKNKLTQSRTGSERDYLNGNSDIHEKNLDFQEQVRNEYLHLCEIESKFKRIDCSDNNQNMAVPEEIFNRIKVELEKHLKKV